MSDKILALEKMINEMMYERKMERNASNLDSKFQCVYSSLDAVLNTVDEIAARLETVEVKMDTLNCNLEFVESNIGKNSQRISSLLKLMQKPNQIQQQPIHFPINQPTNSTPTLFRVQPKSPSPLLPTPPSLLPTPPSTTRKKSRSRLVKN